MYIVLKQMLLPPGLLVLGIVLGLFLWRRHARAGKALAITCALMLYLLATPLFSGLLLSAAQWGIEPFEETQIEKAGAAYAIVILSAGINEQATEFQMAPSVDELTLERLRYGARLHHQTGLPVLVSGGPSRGSDVVVGDVMAESLKVDFNTSAKWTERRSGNTRQNAQFSAEILQRDGIDTVVLVTHAWHMKRARRTFERAGLTVIDGPTVFERPGRASLSLVLPQAKALHQSYYGVHELIGQLWYWITAG